MIVGGIRSAAVQVVATATLGAIFGFGGLGRYLVDGIAQSDDGQLFGGVVLVAGLALAVEVGFALLQRLARPRPDCAAGRSIRGARASVGRCRGPGLTGRHSRRSNMTVP